MARFTRTIPKAANSATEPKCSCGTHQSQLECDAEPRFDAYNIKRIYEDMAEGFVGYVPDYRITDAPDWMQAPSFVEIKPRKLIACVMHEWKVSAQHLESGPVQLHTKTGTLAGLPVSAQFWEEHVSHELAKVQAYVDHFHDDVGWKQTVLVTHVIGAEIETALLIGPREATLTRHHPMVSTGYFEKQTWARSRRQKAGRELYGMVRDFFGSRARNAHPSVCRFCKLPVPANGGVRSDRKIGGKWGVLCQPCLNSARWI